MTSSTLYSLVVEVLEFVNFYCARVVQVPQSTKTQLDNLIVKEMRKYVTHSEFLKYKHFNQGVIHDPHSAHFTIFYTKVKMIHHPLLARAAFKVYNSNAPIKKLMLINKIYAPFILMMPNSQPKIKNLEERLFLIGFQIRNEFSSSEQSTQIVELIYSNPDNFYHFVSTLDLKEPNTVFKDASIPDSQFDFGKVTRINKINIEIIKMTFDLEYLESEFQRNRREAKKKMVELP